MPWKGQTQTTSRAGGTDLNDEKNKFLVDEVMEDGILL